MCKGVETGQGLWCSAVCAREGLAGVSVLVPVEAGEPPAPAGGVLLSLLFGRVFFFGCRRVYGVPGLGIRSAAATT